MSTTQKKELNYSEIEAQLFTLQNNVRANPASFVSKLEDALSRFKENILPLPGEDPVKTFEGAKAVNEAIAFLKQQEPLPKLELSKPLENACRDHVLDIGQKGLASHEGSDASNVSDRIERYCEWDRACAESIDFGYKLPENILMNLIVDDGVKQRNQRKNLFNPEFHYVGIAVGPHRDYGVTSVFTYAAGVRALGEESPEVKNFIRDYVDKTLNKKEKPKNVFQEDDTDAPDNTVSVKIVKLSKVIEGKQKKITRKIYTLDTGTQHIVEIEDDM